MAERTERTERTRRTLSLRARITLASVAIVAVALIVGTIGFSTLLRGGLLDAVSASLDQDATEVAAVLDRGDELPEYDDDRFVQVVTESGDVVDASEDAPRDQPVIPLDTEDAVEVTLPGDGRFLAAVEETDDDRSVIVGRSLDDVQDTLATVMQMLLVGVPFLIVLVGTTSWIAVGRALAPVDRMTREVQHVTAARLDRRVADPGVSDEIGRLARTMNSMLDGLEASQTAQRRFISDASHELKSPLASLRQYAEVAIAHPDRVDAADLSNAVLEEGDRLQRLVQGMLLLARADEHSLAAETEPVDLDDLLLGEVRRLKDSTSLRVDASGIGAARTTGSETLLGRVVRNLTDNAARHATDRVALTLRIDESTTECVLTVEDDGPGIPSDERERIFERFVRLDEARDRDAGGSGLGLAIVSEIVRTHDGSVRVDDSPLGGARVTVRLPAAE